jgi:hypothetical protein
MENARRFVAVMAIVVVDMALFWWVGYTVDPADAASLRTRLDDAIPFVPWTVYLYSWVYTAMLYPLFVIRCPRLFDRALVAYGIVLVVSLAFFVGFPITAHGFRPDVSGLPLDSFHAWGVRLTFHVDPPTNLFPSQHVSVATIAMLLGWKARRAWGLLMLPVVTGILISISTMKQHFVADGIAGIILAAAVYLLVVRSYRPQSTPPDEVAWSWRGPAGYFLFHALVYLAFFVLYLADYQPWQVAS